MLTALDEETQARGWVLGMIGVGSAFGAESNALLDGRETGARTEYFDANFHAFRFGEHQIMELKVS